MVIWSYYDDLICKGVDELLYNPICNLNSVFAQLDKIYIFAVQITPDLSTGRENSIQYLRLDVWLDLSRK